MRNEREMRRREGSDASTRLAYLLIGGGIGALVALLFAPKSGQELRGDIADATRKGIDRTRETATQIGARAGEYYEATLDKAGDVATAAREAAARRGGQLTAAIEAGKQAYAEEKRRTQISGIEPAAPVYDEGKKS
ncbi:MAG TPA: YtxH domain-containing protein [Pyrinomonadaceae bacterium]